MRKFPCFLDPSRFPSFLLNREFWNRRSERKKPRGSIALVNPPRVRKVIRYSRVSVEQTVFRAAFDGQKCSTKRSRCINEQRFTNTGSLGAVSRETAKIAGKSPRRPRYRPRFITTKAGACTERNRDGQTGTKRERQRFGVYKKHKIKFRSPRARNIRALVIFRAGRDARSSPMAFSGTLTIIRFRPGANSLTRVYRCPGRC